MNLSTLASIALALIVAMLPAASSAQGGGPQTVASDEVLALVRGEAIRSVDLDEFWRQNDPRSFRALHEQISKVRTLMLDGAIAERLLRQEAERQRVTVDDLVAVHSRVAPVSDEEVQQMYARSSGSQQGLTLAMASPAIAAFLQQQKVAEARRLYADELRRASTSDVVVLLTPERMRVTRLPTDPVKGAAGAPVAIVEFSDFECPFCAQARPVLDALLKKYAGRVQLVWKDMPSPSHGSAVGAASAAHCAGEQEKFWEYHDVLFTNQDRMARVDLVRYALELGLKADAFRQCLDSGRYQAQVVADARKAASEGVSATPTVVINGRSFTGLASMDAYERALVDELEKSDAPVMPSASWPDVRNLSPDTPVRVVDSADRTIDGAMRSASDDGIVVVVGQSPIDVRRASIRRVERADGTHAVRGALIGALVGAAGGVIQGALTVDTNKRVWIPALAAGWAAIGAPIGAFEGSRRQRYVPIYESP